MFDSAAIDPLISYSTSLFFSYMRPCLSRLSQSFKWVWAPQLQAIGRAALGRRRIDATEAQSHRIPNATEIDTSRRHTPSQDVSRSVRTPVKHLQWSVPRPHTHGIGGGVQMMIVSDLFDL